MRRRNFRFSLTEFAGSLGDMGTLIPFVVSYIASNRLNPTSILLGIGLPNIFLALVYRLPLPVQSKKVVGTVAIADRWRPGLVFGTEIGLGVLWLFLAAMDIIKHLVKITLDDEDTDN